MNEIYLLKKRLETTSIAGLRGKNPGKARLWIDLTEPTKEELESLTSMFDIHPLVLEDMSKVGTRPKVESFPEYDFIVIYGLYIGEKIRVVELDFIIGRNFIISSHGKKIESYEGFKRDASRVEALLRKGPDFMLHQLIDLEIDNYMPIISSLDTELEELEKKAIHSPTPQMLTKLFDIKRQLLNVRKVSSPERDVLSQLAKRDYEYISEHAEAYFRDVYDHIIRINDQIENYREVISSILEVHLSVTSNKLNEIMKVLTVIATLMMPITAIAGIYGMNFKYMPELGWKYGYFAILAVMLVITIWLVIYMKRKKWF
jgi:magnesium transporter